MTPQQITSALAAINAAMLAQGNVERLQLVQFWNNLNFVVSQGDAITAQALILAAAGHTGPALNNALIAAFN